MGNPLEGSLAQRVGLAIVVYLSRTPWPLPPAVFDLTATYPACVPQATLHPWARVKIILSLKYGRQRREELWP